MGLKNGRFHLYPRNINLSTIEITECFEAFACKISVKMFPIVKRSKKKKMIGFTCTLFGIRRPFRQLLEFFHESVLRPHAEHSWPLRCVKISKNDSRPPVTRHSQNCRKILVKILTKFSQNSYKILAIKRPITQHFLKIPLKILSKFSPNPLKILSKFPKNSLSSLKILPKSSLNLLQILSKSSQNSPKNPLEQTAPQLPTTPGNRLERRTEHSMRHQ